MITWFSDMASFARTGFGLWQPRPEGVPEPSRVARARLGGTDLREIPNLLHPLTWRLDYRVAGMSVLDGLEGPVIFVANGQGVMDWQVLRAALPARLRTTNRNLHRALRRGRSVAIFSEEPTSGGAVGEVTPQAAELANLYNVPIVPVALIGTFKLNEVLQLALLRRPSIFARFGAPRYVWGRRLADATAELQAALGVLFSSGELTWWAIQQASPAPVGEPMPRWRRLWQQSAPRAVSRRRIWAKGR